MLRAACAQRKVIIAQYTASSAKHVSRILLNARLARHGWLGTAGPESLLAQVASRGGNLHCDGLPASGKYRDQ